MRTALNLCACTKGGVQRGFLADFLAAFEPAPALGAVTWHHYYTAGRGGVVSAAEYLDPAFLDSYVDAARAASAAVGGAAVLVGGPCCLSSVFIHTKYNEGAPK